MLTVVVLTRNDERHIARCLESVAGVADQALVVDSFASDETVALAKENGAEVRHRAWISFSNQFNWALDQLDDDTEWVLRLDADEYLTPELRDEIAARLPGLEGDVNGVSVDRRLVFQGCKIAHGGVYPVRTVRLFRRGRGRCEDRWINERILVDGPVVHFAGELIDENLESLSDWIERHNRYASREAVDLLDRDHDFLGRSREDAGGRSSGRGALERLYFLLPAGLRAFLFFLYRYYLRLGFLDGKAGTTFHFLQGFWYRYLVDAKVREVRRCMAKTDCDVEAAIERVLDIHTWRLRNAAAEA